MKRPLIILSILATICALAYLFFPRATSRAMGRVENLQAPTAITGWTKDGLQNSAGRTIPIPGITNLPATSDALTEATKRGVEISPDGRIISLVRVYRWCGNDPITAEILRVDLSDMLTFLQIGDPAAPVPNPRYLSSHLGGAVRPDSGWDCSDYFAFQFWQSSKNQTLDRNP